MITVSIENSRASKQSASGFKGIIRNGNGWEACININHKNQHKKIYIGTYPSIELAVEARKNFIIDLL